MRSMKVLMGSILAWKAITLMVSPSLMDLQDHASTSGRLQLLCGKLIQTIPISNFMCVRVPILASPGHTKCLPSLETTTSVTQAIMYNQIMTKHHQRTSQANLCNYVITLFNALTISNICTDNMHATCDKFNTLTIF